MRARSSKNRFIPPVSPPQMFLYSQIRQKFPLAKLNFPIKTDKCTRYADIYIESNGLDSTSFKLCIEYDGYYHKYKRRQDRERDLELARAGIKTIRVNKKNVDDVFRLIEEEISK